MINLDEKMIKEVSEYIKKVVDFKIKNDLCYKYDWNSGENVKVCEMDEVDEKVYEEMRREFVMEDSDYIGNIEDEFMEEVSKKVDELYKDEFSKK